MFFCDSLGRRRGYPPSISYYPLSDYNLSVVKIAPKDRTLGAKGVYRDCGYSRVSASEAFFRSASRIWSF